MITNSRKTVVYTGVTNDLERRIYEHQNELFPGFAQKYKCRYLVYYEHYTQIEHAIEREKQLKNWSRKKKNDLIQTKNPEWNFLNDKLLK
jgi:putative endonuclease